MRKVVPLIFTIFDWRTTGSMSDIDTNFPQPAWPDCLQDETSKICYIGTNIIGTDEIMYIKNGVPSAFIVNIFSSTAITMLDCIEASEKWGFALVWKEKLNIGHISKKYKYI